MSIERRLKKLEAEQAGDGGLIVIRKLIDEPDDEAIRRHFEDQESPKNALIVLIQKFCCEGVG